VFVSLEPAERLAIGVIERMVGALKRRVRAFAEPELRLIGAVHAEGMGGCDRKKDRGGMSWTVLAALGCAGS
jgi:hypothetical protein